ncbi:MAG: PAS domain S-box protein [Nitrospiraceae bacterium]|nr:PAS domain S-box protein [Nitrospiraceae bacterium]
MSADSDRKYRRQWFLTSGILLLLGMVLAYDLYLERRKTESVEHDRLLVQARVIDENLSHQLVATYQSMQRIVNDLPYWRARDTYRPEASIMLKTIEEAMPEVRTLIIIDAKGIARASSRPELIGRDLSQREYFQIVRRHPDPVTMYLSPPYTTVLNVYVMTVTRMVPGPTGGFNGIIVAALDPEYFKTLLASVQYAPDMWVAIAHGAGQQFMIVPDRPGQAGEERIMALRTIHPAAARLDEPLIVTVGRDLHAVFADWRRETMIYGSVFLLIVVITVFSLRHNQISVRRAEEERYANEIKFRAIFENSVDAIGVSREGIHVFVNPAYAALFGYSSTNELVGKPVLELIVPGERATIQDRIQRRAQGAAVPTVYETRGLRQNGSEFVMDVHASTYELFGEIFTLVVMRDITERRHAEQEREELITEMQNALAEIKTLRGILPICSNCKKIRDDKGAWTQIEAYISDHTDAEFSHGLCDICAQKLYPKYFKEDL